MTVDRIDPEVVDTACDVFRDIFYEEIPQDAIRPLDVAMAAAIRAADKARGLHVIQEGRTTYKEAGSVSDIADRPLTERQVAILGVLADAGGRPVTPNDIGWALGFQPGEHKLFRKGHQRSMGPAQKVIGSLNGLKRRDYIRPTRRQDGLSGTAYWLTSTGRSALLLARKEKAAGERG